MELHQDSKIKPGVSSSENNLKTANTIDEGSQHKYAKVYRCDRGILWYVCLFCGEDFSKTLELEKHTRDHLANKTPTLDTKDHRSDSVSHKGRNDTDNCVESLEVSAPLETIDDVVDVELSVFLHTIEVKCEHCEETFYCQSLKTLHCRQKHKISYAYNCHQCNAGFNQEDSFNRHKELHGNINNPGCMHCEPNVVIKQPKKSYSCQSCDKTFGWKHSLNNHFKSVHLGERYWCDICKYKANYKTHLYNHFKSVHLVDRYRCSNEGNFGDIDISEDDVKCFSHKGRNDTDNCVESLEVSAPLETIEESVDVELSVFLHTIEVKCEHCEETFYCQSLKTLHCRQKHKIFYAYNCHQCNAGFNQEDSFNRHKELHGNINNPGCMHCEPNVVIKQPKKSYSCQLCDKTFGWKLSRNNHFKSVHLGERYCCDICQYKAKYKSHLSNHFKSVHLGERYRCSNEGNFGDIVRSKSRIPVHTKSVKCEDCEETFSCQGLQKQHRRQKHNISFLYDCRLCNGAFDEKDKFERHKKLHGTLNNPACQHCKQIFGFQSDFNEHLQQNKNDATVKRSKRFACHSCDKTFPRRYDLTTHIKSVHLGERYSCDICPHIAKYKSNLIKHKYIHTGERPHSCDICDKKFRHRSHLIDHKETHIRGKPYKCNICGLAVHTKIKLNRHIKLKHFNEPKKKLQ